MTVHPSPKNLAKDIVRQAWPKRQPRQPKPPKEFPDHVKAIIVARSGGQCEIGDCQAPMGPPHHRRPRGSGGSSLAWVNRAANGLAVCPYHHDFIESHRALAYVEGWLISQHRKDVMAVDVPVLRRGRSVLLGDDGSVRPVGGVSDGA